MITFSQQKHIVPYAGFISIPVDEGYMILSKDDYEDILYVAHTVTEMELVDRFGEPCKALTGVIPHSLTALAYLPSLLSFDTDGLSIEQLIGCCAVILVNKRFSNLVELSADDFSVLRFSEYILKEYHIPWKHFLDTCIPADDFDKPLDTIPNKYVFLSLYPGQAPAMPGIAHQPALFPVPSGTETSQRSEWEDFTENPDMMYVGSGAFMHRTTFSMYEISGYDEDVERLIQQRLKELGRGTDGGNDTPVPAAAPAVIVSNPPEEAEQIRHALFNRPGG